MSKSSLKINSSVIKKDGTLLRPNVNLKWFKITLKKFNITILHTKMHHLGNNLEIYTF